VPDAVVMAARRERRERERRANAECLARMRRLLVHAFPARSPVAVVLLDTGRRELTTLLGAELEKAREIVQDYDIIAGVDIRGLLRELEVEQNARRLAELGPPQKSKRLNRQGRTLRITTELLIQGSCNIVRPLANAAKLHGYLRAGQDTRFRRRLEADAKSLFALYQYGRLHGAVRLRWGFLDEMLPVPWVHRDEPTLFDLVRQASDLDRPLEVVAGTAPGWTDPWSRARMVRVERGTPGSRTVLIDETGWPLEMEEIQLARVAGNADGPV
jgi:hypothetical protein